MIRKTSIFGGLRSRSIGLVAALAAGVLVASCGSSATTSGSSSFGSGDGSTFLAGDSDVFHVTGTEGGPFPEGRREYWIKNTAKHKALRWSVAATIPWLDFSEKGGLLGAGQTTTVLAEIDHDVAESLAPGDYPADIVFRDARKGGGELYLSFLLTVTEDDSTGSMLLVTPDEAFETSGDVGGPLDPPSKLYTLENDGDEAIDWVASPSEPWIVLASAVSGTLQPNERYDVVVEIDASHPDMDAGVHAGLVDFENVSHGLGTTSREVLVDLSGDSDGGRVLDGLQALYNFDESQGTTIRDTSGMSPPLDLVIEDPTKATWLPGALSFTAPTRAKSVGSAARIESAMQATQELTLEAWITPDNLTQDGPARILTMSDGAYLRNFTLGQGLWGSQASDTYNVRLRSTETDQDGMPMLTTGAGAAKIGLQHVVFTRTTSGKTRLYVDGTMQVEGNTGGGFSNWDPAYSLALGNEIGTSRPWLGTMHLVAMYDRALSAAEVQQNLLAGPDDDATGYLKVTPSTNWSVTGKEGSEFKGQSKVYTLENPGEEPIDFGISFSEPWVDIVGSLGGLLQPGEEYDARVVLRNELVSTFTPGVYTATVQFQNETNGYGGTSIQVVLNITSDDGGGGGGTGEKPGPHNTGPYDESILVPSGSIKVTQDGTVLENLKISGTVEILANNVTLRNFTLHTGSNYGIRTHHEFSGTVIEDGEITGAASAGIYGPNFTARRLEIHEMQTDAMKCRGNNIVEGCWIHHVGIKEGAHADGSQTRVGSNILFRANFFDMPKSVGSPYKSNANTINQAELGDVVNVVLDSNWLEGGNYTVYFEAKNKYGQYNLDNCKLINNRFGRDYLYGVLRVDGNVTNLEVHGNVWDDTGEWMSINDDY